MNVRIIATCTSLLALFACLAPAPARAQVHDCSRGCYIVTCNETNCSAWRCDERGCRLVSSWPREMSLLPQGTVSRKGKPAVAPAPETAWAKVCPEGQPCELYELHTDQALLLGRFDNVDDQVRYRRSLRQ